ncbi:MAG: terpene cyclase/mutase family protein [Candidatus Heimdallarchaeota archaeon]|nr:terpene cyclase/mutase family protein [Candidatus Heimdallarchaeota archaeon]MCK4876133.1 terpene cyclase/mutase family protein [Candidatus Heimdallarchaeota archaeon]
MNEISLDIQKAIKYVMEKCKETDKYKLHLLLDELKDAELEVKDFLLIQNKDGGIPYRFERNSISTISSTIMFFRDILLLNQESLVTVELEEAIQYLLSLQKLDGCFEEPSELGKLECAAWEAPGFESTQLYCTSVVINFLCGTRKSNVEDAIVCGLNFLSKKWDDEKGFRSYPHSLWNAIPVFISKKGENDSISRRGAEMLETLQLRNYPSSSLVSMIESFIHAGLENHSFVNKLFEILSTRQLPDGRWTSEDGEDYDFATTLAVLMILKRLGRLQYNN